MSFLEHAVRDQSYQQGRDPETPLDMEKLKSRETPKDKASKKSIERHTHKVEQEKAHSEKKEAITEEEVKEKIKVELTEDAVWLKQEIDAMYPDVSEEVRQQILEKYASVEAKQGFFNAVWEGLKNQAGRATVGTLAGIVGQAGVNYSIGLAKMAARVTLGATGLAGGIIVGGVAGGIYGGVRTYYKERYKIEKNDFIDQLDEARETGDHLRMAQIIAQAEKQYKSGSFQDAEMEDMRQTLLAQKVFLELSLHRKEIAEQTPKEKISRILAASKNAHSDLEKHERAEVDNLINEIKFRTEKNAALGKKIKKSIATGAIVGAIGGTLGGIISNYLFGSPAAHAVQEVVGNEVKSVILPAPQQEQLRALTAQSMEQAREQFLQKNMEAVAQKGDGAVKLYRSMIHDYLVNDGKLGGNGLSNYSKEQLNYAEEYLNKQHGLVLEGGDTHVDVGDKAALSAVEIEKALQVAKGLKPEQLDNLKALLEGRDHKLSEETIAKMYSPDFYDANNNYSDVVVSPEQLGPILQNLENSTELSIPQEENDGARLGKTGTSHNNRPGWLEWSALGLAVAGAGAVAVYAGLKGRRRGHFEGLLEAAPILHGFEIIMPENKEEYGRVLKQDGKLLRLLNRHRQDLEGVKIYFETDKNKFTQEDSGTHAGYVDEEDGIHINIYAKGPELDAFIQSTVIELNAHADAQLAVEEKAREEQFNQEQAEALKAKREAEINKIRTGKFFTLQPIEKNEPEPLPQPPIEDDIQTQAVDELEDNREPSPQPAIEEEIEEAPPEEPVPTPGPKRRITIKGSAPIPRPDVPFESNTPDFEDVFGAPDSSTPETGTLDTEPEQDLAQVDRTNVVDRLHVNPDKVSNWEQLTQVKGNVLRKLTNIVSKGSEKIVALPQQQYDRIQELLHTVDFGQAANNQQMEELFRTVLGALDVLGKGTFTPVEQRQIKGDVETAVNNILSLGSGDIKNALRDAVKSSGHASRINIKGKKGIKIS